MLVSIVSKEFSHPKKDIKKNRDFQYISWEGRVLRHAVIFSLRFDVDRRRFRSQISDSMDRWKAESGRGREESQKRKPEKRRSKIESQRKSEDVRRKEMYRKAVKHCVFSMACVSGGSKSRLAKAAGAEPAGQMKDELNKRLLSTIPVCTAQGGSGSFKIGTL